MSQLVLRERGGDGQTATPSLLPLVALHSLPFTSLHFIRSNPAQLPWRSNPCSLFSDAAKYSKTSPAAAI